MSSLLCIRYGIMALKKSVAPTTLSSDNTVLLVTSLVILSLIIRTNVANANANINASNTDMLIPFLGESHRST